MNVGRVLGRFAVVGLAAGYMGLATAADQPVVVAPAAPAAEVCPTCTAGEAGGVACGKAGCKKCNGCNPKKPVVGQLRPGACYGYFQTQWHRWEDVCPIPYQGVGINDAPLRAPTPLPYSTPRSDAPAKAAPAPMPMTNPMPMQPKTGGIPGIPTPDGKFGK